MKKLHPNRDMAAQAMPQQMDFCRTITSGKFILSPSDHHRCIVNNIFEIFRMATQSLGLTMAAVIKNHDGIDGVLEKMRNMKIAATVFPHSVHDHEDPTRLALSDFRR